MNISTKRVGVGFIGSIVDAGRGPRRWERWRPTLSLFQQPDLHFDRYELLVGNERNDVDTVVADIGRLAPETEVEVVSVPFDDAWDFEEVYARLHDFARARSQRGTDEDLLIHMTTGSHVMQICLFLLTEARFLPARLIQTSPPRRGEAIGNWTIIDLALDRYDAIARRYEAEQRRSTSLLKDGIQTRNAAFNAMMDGIERVALRSTAPVLLTGPTGAGKTRLARRIFELRKQRGVLDGPMVEVNCATLRGDQAMAALFGHVKGAFTGAHAARAGLLAAADGGLLFLDEVAELGLDEQAMLLRAIEEGRFLPVGADRESASQFQLIVGTHADLHERVGDGRFRQDLLARIDLWRFALPGLAQRREDIEPNLQFELDLYARETGRAARFTVPGRRAFLDFANAPGSLWSGNFRDLHASIHRMATLAESGRIGVADVDAESARLRARWGATPRDAVDALLGESASNLDRFERVQLADVIEVCRASRSLAEAGRTLFQASRERRKSVNDSDRLRKYLAKYALTFADCNKADRDGQDRGPRW